MGRSSSYLLLDTAALIGLWDTAAPISFWANSSPAWIRLLVSSTHLDFGLRFYLTTMDFACRASPHNSAESGLDFSFPETALIEGFKGVLETVEVRENPLALIPLPTPLENDTRNEEPTPTPHMGLGSKGAILGKARHEFATTSENQHPQDPKNQTANMGAVPGNRGNSQTVSVFPDPSGKGWVSTLKEGGESVGKFFKNVFAHSTPPLPTDSTGRQGAGGR